MIGQHGIGVSLDRDIALPHDMTQTLVFTIAPKVAELLVRIKSKNRHRRAAGNPACPWVEADYEKCRAANAHPEIHRPGIFRDIWVPREILAISVVQSL